MFFLVEHIPAPECMQRCVEQLAMLVPVKRREQAFCYRHLHGQYCCLRTWQMLHELLLSHAFITPDCRLADLSYDVSEQGKPYLTLPASLQHRPIHFSISHTKNALAVAVSEQEVGIDIEALISPQRLNDEAFLNYTLSQQEQALLRATDAQNAQRLFTRLWTRKEALFKLLGTGINVSRLPSILEDSHPYTIESYDGNEYVCSIAHLTL